VGGDGAITAILERMSKLQAAANAQQNVIWFMNYSTIIIIFDLPT
jgi:hypothetical protein